MIEISPKALRFARLAAEQQAAFSSDPQIDIIKQAEALFCQKESHDRIGHYIQISARTADLCMRAVSAFLEIPDQFDSSEWDGNDFVFLQIVRRSLQDQLMQTSTRIH